MRVFSIRVVSILGLGLLTAFTCIRSGCAGPSPPGWETSLPIHAALVVASYPHDTQAFTQGLAIQGGELYESTGNYGESVVRRVDLETGRVLQETRLEPNVFGEGITLWGDALIQLTWREGLGYIYDRSSLRGRLSFVVQGEGWGITQDGHQWITSNGTEVLSFLRPATQTVTHQVRVCDGDRPVRYLNELEYVEGQVWANIWHQDMIAQIDPGTGQVLGYIDLSGLYPEAERQSTEQVLNGIAYDPDTGRLFVTGKNWPWLFEIRVAEGTQD